jgi:phasin
MIEATTSKTATRTASSYGLPNYEMPRMEMPAEFREMTDKGVAHARDTFEKAKVASEQAADLLANTYTTAANGATNYNLKVIEIARANTRAAFDCAHELLGVKSPSEFIELWTAHVRKQLEVVSVQNKELCALAQKVATETAGPIHTGVSKAFNKTP